MERCGWARTDLAIRHHDEEWGVPVHDDIRFFFEFLILEGAQAGLTWDTILAKRERYRQADAGFDPRKVARFTAAKQQQLLADPGHRAQPVEGGGFGRQRESVSEGAGGVRKL